MVFAYENGTIKEDLDLNKLVLRVLPQKNQKISKKIKKQLKAKLI